MKMVPTEIGFKAMRGETLPTAEVEALWTSKLRAFRNRILAPKQGQLPVAAAEGEFDAATRAALTELAEGSNADHRI